MYRSITSRVANQFYCWCSVFVMLMMVCILHYTGCPSSYLPHLQLQLVNCLTNIFQATICKFTPLADEMAIAINLNTLDNKTHVDTLARIHERARTQIRPHSHLPIERRSLLVWHTLRLKGNVNKWKINKPQHHQSRSTKTKRENTSTTTTIIIVVWSA